MEYARARVAVDGGPGRPGEPFPAFHPGGTRLGMPAVTTRGMRERKMRDIARHIAQVLEEVASYAMPRDREA